MTRNPIFPNVLYRTFPTARDYSFTFAWVLEARSWRAYIDVSPDYRGRPADAHASHRLSDEHGSYVCWDSPIATLSECQGVAALWADCTENYIRFGEFKPPPHRPQVQDQSALAQLPPTVQNGRTSPSGMPTGRTTRGPRPADSIAQRLLDRARRALR